MKIFGNPHKTGVPRHFNNSCFPRKKWGLRVFLPTPPYLGIPWYRCYLIVMIFATGIAEPCRVDGYVSIDARFSASDVSAGSRCFFARAKKSWWSGEQPVLFLLHHRRLSVVSSPLPRCANGESPLPLRLGLRLTLRLGLFHFLSNLNLCLACYISSIATTIDIASDVGTLDRMGTVGIKWF